MIITRITGGLGNQMFQYAAGRALSLRLGCELKLDISWYSPDNPAYEERPFLLRELGISVHAATEQEISLLKYKPRSFLHKVFQRPAQLAKTYKAQPCFQYWPEFSGLFPPAYIDGYWQSEKYFLGYSTEIKADFKFPALPKIITTTLAPILESSVELISIHIRRGDYVNNARINAVHGICSTDYYTSAMDLLKQKTSRPLHALIFSDEPDWVERNFDTFGVPRTVINFPEQRAFPYHDMHLMTLCKHHIIANSSFSWWGAWLSKEPGITCAPKKWFADSKIDTSDLIPDRWLKI